MEGNAAYRNVNSGYADEKFQAQVTQELPQAYVYEELNPKVEVETAEKIRERNNDKSRGNIEIVLQRELTIMNQF